MLSPWTYDAIPVKLLLFRPSCIVRTSAHPSHDLSETTHSLCWIHRGQILTPRQLKYKRSAWANSIYGKMAFYGWPKNHEPCCVLPMLILPHRCRIIGGSLPTCCNFSVRPWPKGWTCYHLKGGPPSSPPGQTQFLPLTKSLGWWFFCNKSASYRWCD